MKVSILVAKLLSWLIASAQSGTSPALPQYPLSHRHSADGHRWAALETLYLLSEH